MPNPYQPSSGVPINAAPQRHFPWWQMALHLGSFGFVIGLGFNLSSLPGAIAMWVAGLVGGWVISIRISRQS